MKTNYSDAELTALEKTIGLTPAQGKNLRTPKVPIASKTMLPKYSDDDLTALAVRVGLTLEQLKKLHNLCHQTYQYIGADLGPTDRECLVEVVLDANYLEMACGSRMPVEIKEWLRTKASTYNLDYVYQAVAAGFAFPRYE